MDRKYQVPTSLCHGRLQLACYCLQSTVYCILTATYVHLYQFVNTASLTVTLTLMASSKGSERLKFVTVQEPSGPSAVDSLWASERKHSAISSTSPGI